MKVANFEDIQAEFMRRAEAAIYCNVATVDPQGRPRSRVLHLVWEGTTGWVITKPDSPKARDLQHNPQVSIAYFHDPYKPLYIEATTKWVTDVDEQWRVWHLYKTIPLGWDLEPHYGSIENPLFGLLKFIPWRIELAQLGEKSLVWQMDSTET